MCTTSESSFTSKISLGRKELLLLEGTDVAIGEMLNRRRGRSAGSGGADQGPDKKVAVRVRG